MNAKESLLEVTQTTEMRRVMLIDNPVSGSNTPRRKGEIEEATALLRVAGVAVERQSIDGPGSGAALAREAVERGFDSVLVCGGDGTVHAVLQNLVGADVALGVIPMGTANALAADLGLKKSPRQAVEALLGARRVKVPVGRISCRRTDGTESSRYFTVAAGIGADALMMKRMDPALKRRLGYLLYLMEAFRIWLTHPFPLFRAKFGTNGTARTAEASQILAVRVRSFGGVLGNLAPGATLRSESLCLLAFKTQSRLKYLRFLLAVVGKRQTFSEDVELLAADTVECLPNPGAETRVFVEADGEVLGQLPARLEIASQMLTLLVPADAKP